MLGIQSMSKMEVLKIIRTRKFWCKYGTFEPGEFGHFETQMIYLKQECQSKTPR